MEGYFMPHVIEMPKLSDTMEEGGISEWFKKEGEKVEEGDLLVAIDTDKATMEYASPEEGYVIKILEQPGAQVSLGTPIAVLGEKGEKYTAEKKVAQKPVKKEKRQSLSKSLLQLRQVVKKLRERKPPLWQKELLRTRTLIFQAL